MLGGLFGRFALVGVLFWLVVSGVVLLARVSRLFTLSLCCWRLADVNVFDCGCVFVWCLTFRILIVLYIYILLLDDCLRGVVLFVLMIGCLLLLFYLLSLLLVVLVICL